MNLTKSRFILKIVRPTQVILLEFMKTYSNVFDFDLLCKVIFLKGIYFSLDGHPSAYQPRTARLNISAFFSQAAGLTLLALGIYTAKYGTGVGAR